MNKEQIKILSRWFYVCGTMPSTEDMKKCRDRAEMLANFIEQEGYKIVKQRDWDGLMDMTLDKIREVLQEHLDMKEKK